MAIRSPCVGRNLARRGPCGASCQGSSADRGRGGRNRTVRFSVIDKPAVRRTERPSRRCACRETNWSARAASRWCFAGWTAQAPSTSASRATASSTDRATRRRSRAMRSRGINAVRVPLNQACWNGESYIMPAYAGARYRAAITAYVRLLTASGMVAILDLHWTDGAYTGNTSACSSARRRARSRCPTRPRRCRSGGRWPARSRVTTRSSSTFSMSRTRNTPTAATRPRAGSAG